VVINDFDFIRIAFSPYKTDAPALVYADAVLSTSVANKLLKTISRWNAQVIEDSGHIEDFELSTSVSLNLWRQLARELPGEDLFSLLVCETIDHTSHNNASR